MLGEAYRSAGQYEPALSALNKAREILANIVAERPNQPTFRNHLGAAWLQKGDKPKARKEFEAALANRPSAEELGKIKELLAKAST